MQAIIVVFITVLWISLSNAKGLSDLETFNAKPSRCTYERAYDMYGAHCVGLKLTKIPSLKSGIEILDLSDNKLKELETDTFSSYTSIRFLYLTDNSIFFIHPDTFSALSSLETLDLSLNVIQTIPLSILNLGSLRKLYLSGNPLVSFDIDVKSMPKPIKAPLEQLDISNCRLFYLPNLGLIPQLNFYNVSHNPLRSLEPSHFANACNLAKIDLTESTQLMKVCDLKPAVTWFQEKFVYITLADYSQLNSAEYAECEEPEISSALNATYNICKNEYFKVQTVKTSRNKWLSIGGGLAGFLVAFILLLYLMHMRTVAQTKKAANKHTHRQTDVTDKKAAVNLIASNDNVKTGT